MEKIFNYFDNRYRQNLVKGDANKCGPIITLSRQTGCDAIAVAKKVVHLLNKQQKTDKWHWIDKEILLKTAKELKTGTPRIERYIKGKELSGFSEMIMSVSGDFVSDESVRKKIREVVLSICNDGYVVLVGRGGVSISREVKRSLHIRLVAPFYWRVENIMKKRKMNIEDAEEFTVDTDEKRHNLILNFLEKKPLNIDYLFDATINRSSFSIDQLAEIVIESYNRRLIAVMSKDGLQKNNLLSAYG